MTESLTRIRHFFLLPAIALAVPTLAWMAWLMFFPLSQQGYGPALTQFVMLNLAVFLAVVIAVRLQQHKSRA